MSILPGAFPIAVDDGHHMHNTTSISRELHMNSLHTRKLRFKKLSKEGFKNFDLILTVQILIVYFIDNSIIKLLLRYSLQYFLLNLNSILDDLLVMNERTFTTNEEEINARDSLNALINNLKMRYKSSLMSGIIIFNLFCIWHHFYFIQISSQDEYLFGFCFLNIIGQLKLHHRYPILIFDVFIFFQQLLFYNIKFNNKCEQVRSLDNEFTNSDEEIGDAAADATDDDDDDGYQGNLKIYEVDMLPHLNKNFLVEYIGWDYGYRLGSNGASYGSV